MSVIGIIFAVLLEVGGPGLFLHGIIYLGVIPIGIASLWLSYKERS